MIWGALIAYVIWKARARDRAHHNIHSMFAQQHEQQIGIMMNRQPARPAVPQTEHASLSFSGSSAAVVQNSKEMDDTAETDEEDISDEKELLIADL